VVLGHGHRHHRGGHGQRCNATIPRFCPAKERTKCVNIARSKVAGKDNNKKKMIKYV
jgi:hypothetical protein